MNNKKLILFITPYPFDQAPSQRFRFEQYFNALKGNHFNIDFYPFVSSSSYHKLYKAGHFFGKFILLITGFINRIRTMIRVPRADFIFIHREITPIGPPVFEWIIAKVFRKKIIYDFDDAIWGTDNLNESKLEKLIRWRSKVRYICRWSYRVSCGNEYLCAFARQYNSAVVCNPTTIDTSALHTSEMNTSGKEKITIGWTGSHTTLKYLKTIESVLAELEKKYPALEVLIIANEKPELKIQSLKYVPWTKDTEVEDLQKIDIGIMPLPDDEWTKGKCGFKALQYMALEIPSVVSSVGVNINIIDHGINGFQASTQSEWFNFLELLINNVSLRMEMGKSGREKVIESYSVSSNTSTFLSLFL